ncbi:hypothetical protein HD806DRAFT_544112 [Xylariaceae sp. AK1471]|nr:hypothetical protein HD806DRAFT_544112 [Xylariaceae sp. AK1471]
MFANHIALVALSALTMLVSAQSSSNSTFKIDPSLVNALDQSTWCSGQQDSCQTLCGSVPILNMCDTTSLNFECECTGGSYPDMNKFMNTMPWFVCTRLQQNCIVTEENNAAGQKNCTATYGDKCGTESVQDHQGEGAAQPTTSSSATAEPTSQSTGAPTSSSSNAAALPTAHIQHIGNGAAAVAIGVLAYVL